MNEATGVSLSASMPTCQLCLGCQIETWGGGYCRDCQRHQDVLDSLYGAWELRAQQRREDAEFEAWLQLWFARVRLAWDCVWIGALIVGAAYVAAQYLPWLQEWEQMWFGGAQ